MKKILFALTPFLVATGYYFFPEETLPTNCKITRIIVRKSDRRLDVYSGNELLKSYPISLGKCPEGDKVAEGDNRTPEGHYAINDKNPNSAFYKNLGISYPDQSDMQTAKERGVNPGGQIKIHGLKNGIGLVGKFHRLIDWTAGCIAVTNEEMDELYNNIAPGTPIIIKP